MSGLRRSRPDEHDAALKRLQEISITRHETEHEPRSPKTHSPTSPSNDTISCITESSGQSTASEPQKPEQHFFPPVLMISKLPSSPAVNRFEENLNLVASSVGGQITPAPMSPGPSSPDRLGINPSLKHMNQPLSPGQGLPVIRKPTACGRTSPKILSSCTPLSPKNRTVSETAAKMVTRQGHHNQPLSSPSSPSLMLKHFKLFSTSGFDSSKRRGSEPILDSHGGNEFKKIQLRVTDRRWEKLRSILVAMKDEPVNTEEMLDPTPPDFLENLQNKISAQEELSCLSREISDLNVILQQKESDILQLELERNSALAYIRKIKYPTPAYKDEASLTILHNEQGIQGLRADDVTKEEVIEVTAHLLKEVTSQRVYLERLMSLVLTHAPWLLDDVDRSLNASREGDDDDCVDANDYCMYHDSDDEVWC